MKVLLVGSGGREHALAWKLALSPTLGELHAAPGNPGIARLGRCHPVHAEDVEGLLGLCMTFGIDLVVVGPDAPLVAGVADPLRHAGIPVFGPGAEAARIEGSKIFAKEVMNAAGRPDDDDARRRQTPVRHQGRRTRPRQGRVRVPHGRGGGRGTARGYRVRRADPDRRVPGRRGAVRLRAGLRRTRPTAGRRARLQADRRRRRGARTPAAWARSRRFPGLRSRSSSTSCIVRWQRSWRAAARRSSVCSTAV